MSLETFLLNLWFLRLACYTLSTTTGGYQDIIESTARIVIAISFHRPSANRRSKSLAVVGLRMYFQSDQNGPQRTRKTCRG